jgi:hypothetical protein
MFKQLKEDRNFDEYVNELHQEVETRLRVAINLTDGQPIQDLLIEALDKLESIDADFWEYKARATEQGRKAVNQVLGNFLESFRVATV